MRVRVRRTPQTRSYICPTSWDADMASFISKRLPVTSLSARISVSDNLHYNHEQIVIPPLPPPPFKHTAIFRRPTYTRMTANKTGVPRPPYAHTTAATRQRYIRDKRNIRTESRQQMNKKKTILLACQYGAAPPEPVKYNLPYSPSHLLHEMTWELQKDEASCFMIHHAMNSLTMKKK